GDQGGLPADTRAALAFARKLTLAAHAVTDEEVARLIELYGEKQVVAMVLLLAYAHFQDRLVLTLDLPLEAGGPLPARDVRFAKRPLGTSYAGPARQGPAGPAAGWVPEGLADPDWTALDLAGIRRELDKQ